MRKLHLTLKKKWFDMIKSGLKKEEYREIKPYWTKRLCGREYDVVEFRNGYSKDSPRLTIEYKGLCRGIGNPILGAPKNPVYIIKLGSIIN